jgi:hypothetical protein
MKQMRKNKTFLYLHNSEIHAYILPLATAAIFVGKKLNVCEHLGYTARKVLLPANLHLASINTYRQSMDLLPIVNNTGGEFFKSAYKGEYGATAYFQDATG